MQVTIYFPDLSRKRQKCKNFLQTPPRCLREQVGNEILLPSVYAVQYKNLFCDEEFDLI